MLKYFGTYCAPPLVLCRHLSWKWLRANFNAKVNWDCTETAAHLFLIFANGKNPCGNKRTTNVAKWTHVSQEKKTSFGYFHSSEWGLKIGLTQCSVLRTSILCRWGQHSHILTPLERHSSQSKQQLHRRRCCALVSDMSYLLLVR